MLERLIGFDEQAVYKQDRSWDSRRPNETHLFNSPTYFQDNRKLSLFQLKNVKEDKLVDEYSFDKPLPRNYSRIENHNNSLDSSYSERKSTKFTINPKKIAFTDPNNNCHPKINLPMSK